MFENTDKFLRKSRLKKGALKVLPENYPQLWKRIFYKEYPRFAYKKILVPDHPTPAFAKLLQARASNRKFNSESVTLEQIAGIIYYSAGQKSFLGKKETDHEEVRFYPSAGMRYPTELYFVSLNISNIEKGVYHFNIKRNLIEFLFNDITKEKVSDAFLEEWASTSAVIFALTSVLTRNQLKYGERGLRYSLLEMGHIGQNILLNCAAFGISACPIGGFFDDKLEELIGIRSDISTLYDTESRERILYCIAAGIGEESGNYSSTL